jgi:hypothetical protein
MTNGEVIRRQDVLDLAKRGVIVSNGNYESVCKAINEIPSAELKTGHWIDREVYDADRWKCSECGRTEPYKEKYCHCGAKMVEPQESEE